jgi:hypothetical protein
MQQTESDTATTTFPLEGWTCPRCEAPLSFRDCIWNAYTKKRVRVFECARCRKLIWGD